jgi:O-antigen/teichoic acid export membrane protein
MELSTLKLRLDRVSQTPLVKNTLWMLLAHGGRLVLQAVYFVVVARALGAEQYGAFVGASAIVSVVSPFAALGTGNLLIKNVSRDRTLFPTYWGNALLAILISGWVFIGALMAIAPLLLPKTIPLALVLLIAVADLIFYKILDTTGQAFQAFSWLSKTALLNLIPNLTRLVAALLFVYGVAQPTVLVWAGYYLASTAIAAGIGVLLVHQHLGQPHFRGWKLKAEMLEGFYFSIGLSAQTIYNDIDKTMLARMATLGATGTYAAAYRLIDVAFVPVKSLLAAAYTKFFQQGRSGITGSLQLAQKLTPIAAGYGIVAGIGLWLIAPAIPSVLGQEYASTVQALCWLAPIPFLKSLHYFAADTLTGAGLQGVRSGMQIGIAVFNILLNMWLIPQYSWQGAAWASLASDGLLVVSLWAIVLFLFCQQTRRAQIHRR